MAKLLGPDFISLQVSKFSSSRMFYTELLGLTVDERFDTPDFVLFDTNSIPFGRTFVFADPDGYRLTANENPWDRFPLGGRLQS